MALVGEEIEGGTEIPHVPSVPEPKYYSAAWTAPAQSASGSFDLTFTVNTDKYQLVVCSRNQDATTNAQIGLAQKYNRIVTTLDGLKKAVSEGDDLVS